MDRRLFALSACLAPVVACGPPAPRPAGPPPAPPAAHATHPARVARPVRVRIPAIGVDAPLVSLGLDASGALEPPRGFREAGWWAGGARPGERGPAVIAGHVDSKTGPAVFFRLDRLRARDPIVIVRRGGSRVRFLVQRVARYRKAAFPTAAVYGPTRGSTLRLITCSGAFDSASGHYLDNTVVYARLG